jgi:hypothetical protein
MAGGGTGPLLGASMRTATGSVLAGGRAGDGRSAGVRARGLVGWSGGRGRGPGLARARRAPAARSEAGCGRVSAGRPRVNAHGRSCVAPLRPADSTRRPGRGRMPVRRQLGRASPSTLGTSRRGGAVGASDRAVAGARRCDAWSRPAASPWPLAAVEARQASGGRNRRQGVSRAALAERRRPAGRIGRPPAAAHGAQSRCCGPDVAAHRSQTPPRVRQTRARGGSPGRVRVQRRRRTQHAIAPYRLVSAPAGGGGRARAAGAVRASSPRRTSRRRRRPVGPPSAARGSSPASWRGAGRGGRGRAPTGGTRGPRPGGNATCTRAPTISTTHRPHPTAGCRGTMEPPAGRGRHGAQRGREVTHGGFPAMSGNRRADDRWS